MFLFGVAHGLHRSKPFPSAKVMTPKESVLLTQRPFNEATDKNFENFANASTWRDETKNLTSGDEDLRARAVQTVAKARDKWEVVSAQDVYIESATAFMQGIADSGIEGAIDRDGDGKIFDGTMYERSA